MCLGTFFGRTTLLNDTLLSLSHEQFLCDAAVLFFVMKFYWIFMVFSCLQCLLWEIFFMQSAFSVFAFLWQKPIIRQWNWIKLLTHINNSGENENIKIDEALFVYIHFHCNMHGGRLFHYPLVLVSFSPPRKFIIYSSRLQFAAWKMYAAFTGFILCSPLFMLLFPLSFFQGVENLQIFFSLNLNWKKL